MTRTPGPQSTSKDFLSYLLKKTKRKLKEEVRGVFQEHEVMCEADPDYVDHMSEESGFPLDDFSTDDLQKEISVRLFIERGEEIRAFTLKLISKLPLSKAEQRRLFPDILVGNFSTDDLVEELSKRAAKDKERRRQLTIRRLQEYNRQKSLISKLSFSKSDKEWVLKESCRLRPLGIYLFSSDQDILDEIMTRRDREGAFLPHTPAFIERARIHNKALDMATTPINSKRRASKKR